ncbi:hypothetical protein HDU79_004626, partial [Rhizoclosmatium sp. JEL0117]
MSKLAGIVAVPRNESKVEYKDYEVNILLRTQIKTVMAVLSSKMTVISIFSLPVELLDEILKHLTTHDMIRFCRVMPVLTEYVDIIVKAGKLLNSTSGIYSWPDMKLSKRTIPILLQHKKAIAALGTLISRFNGVSRFEIAEDFPLDQIETFCDVSSRNVCLMFGAWGPIALSEWSKLVSSAGKNVVGIHLGPMRKNTKADVIEQVRLALDTLNPSEITCL